MNHRLWQINNMSEIFLHKSEAMRSVDRIRGGALKSPQPQKEVNKLQRPNSGFIQLIPHEDQYSSQPFPLTFQATKKKIRVLSVQPFLIGSNNLRVGRKMAKFQLFFQSREQEVFRRGQIRSICWVMKKMEVQVVQFILGCKCPWSRGIVVQEQYTLGNFPAAFFLKNVPQLHQQKCVILRVDSLDLWKIINEEDAFLIP